MLLGDWLAGRLRAFDSPPHQREPGTLDLRASRVISETTAGLQFPLLSGPEVSTSFVNSSGTRKTDWLVGC